MITDPRTRKLFIDQGLNPNEFEQQEVAQPISEQQNPAAKPTPQVSRLGAAGANFAENAIPTVAGGLATGGILSAFGGGALAGGVAGSETGPGALITALIGGAIAAYGAHKLQQESAKAIAPKATEEWNQYLQAAQEQHPWISRGGALATAPLGGMGASTKVLAKGLSGVGKSVLNPIGLTEAATPFEVAAAKNLAIMPAINVASDVAQQGIINKQLPDWRDIAADIGGGMLFNNPNAIGKRMGFHPLVENPVSAAQNATIAAARGRGPTERIPLSKPVEITDITGNADFAKTQAAIDALQENAIDTGYTDLGGKRLVKVAPTEGDVIRLEAQKEVQAKLDAARDETVKAINQKQQNAAEALARNEAYKAYEPAQENADLLGITKQEFLTLEPEEATRRVAERKALNEQLAAAEDARRLIEKQPAGELQEPQAQPAKSAVEIGMEKTSLARPNIPMETTRVSGEPVQSPLVKPSIISTPLKSAKEVSATKGPLGYSEVETPKLKMGEPTREALTPEAKAAFEALAAKRGVELQEVPGLTHEATGNEVAGASYPRPEALTVSLNKINPNVARPETWPHENFHTFWADLKATPGRIAQRLVRRALDSAQKSETFKQWLKAREDNPNLGKFTDTVDEHGKVTTSAADKAAEEFLAQHVDKDTIQRIFSKDRKPDLKNWFADFWANAKLHYANATPEELGRALSRRLVHEPSYTETKGYTYGKGQAQRVQDEVKHSNLEQGTQQQPAPEKVVRTAWNLGDRVITGETPNDFHWKILHDEVKRQGFDPEDDAGLELSTHLFGDGSGAGFLTDKGRFVGREEAAKLTETERIHPRFDSAFLDEQGKLRSKAEMEGTLFLSPPKYSETGKSSSRFAQHFSELTRAADNAKAEARKAKQQELPLEGAPAKFAEMRNVAVDSARFEELGKLFKQPGANLDSPELQKAWAEREAIKNKYGGMPPGEQQNAIREPSTTGVLQREQEQTGEAGSKRGRVEQKVQGIKTPQTSSQGEALGYSEQEKPTEKKLFYSKLACSSGEIPAFCASLIVPGCLL